MAKRSEILNDLHNIINEGLDSVGVTSSVDNSVVAPTGPDYINLYEQDEPDVVDYKGKKFIEDKDGNLQPIDVVDRKKIMESVDAYIDARVEESNAEEAAKLNEKAHYTDIDNNIRLMETISGIKKHCSNARLDAVMNEYVNALAHGEREECIYETFMNRVQPFDYLNEVKDSLAEMNDRASKSKTPIEITKILEFMNKDREWSYIVPLIEDFALDYEKDPSTSKRNILMNQLRLYDSCPYVANIMTTVNATDHESGYVRENAEFIREHAHMDKIFSPVQYIKENECVFAVENQFYVKKGSTVSKLSKSSVGNLSESFIALSKFVNDSDVTINEDDNTIELATADGYMTISEGCVMIGDNKETPETLKNANFMHAKYESYDDLTFLKAAFLCENINNIASLDFVHKVALNESDAKTLDLFKVRNNLFVTAHDNINEEHTFYRSVNPIQLKTIINKHFGMNVSNLFEDLLPNQDKIEKMINETRHEYENKIDTLVEMREKYKNADVSDPDINEGIKNIDHDLAAVKKEYSRFQSMIKEAKNGAGSDELFDSPKAGIIDGSEDDFDGSDDLFDDNFDFDGSDEFGSEDDFEFDGSDGSDFTFENNGSDDAYTTSDNDLMTEPISGDEGLETDPFSDVESSEAQPDDFSLGENPDDFGVSDNDDVPNNEEDPYNANVEDDSDIQEPETEDAPDSHSDHAITSDGNELSSLDYADYKIVKVDFDYNVRTGERKSTGTVQVIVPWVDDNGDLASQTKSIAFYLSEINGEKTPVLDTAGMSLEMYNAVSDAVRQSPYFEMVDAQEGQNTDADIQTDQPERPEKEADARIHDAEAYAPDSEEDAEPTIGDTDYGHDSFDAGSDEVTVLTMDDGIEPTGIDFSNMDGTEAEFPADNINMDGTHVAPGEIADAHAHDDILGIQAEGLNAKTGTPLNESKTIVDFSKIDENFAAMEFNDGLHDNESDVVLPAKKQNDSLALVQDILNTYMEDVSDADMEMGDIEDFDIDGVSVSELAAIIGANSYAFFTRDDDNVLYISSSEEFDDNSENIDDLNKFIGSDDVETIDSSETGGIVVRIKEIVKTENDDDFDYEYEGSDGSDDGSDDELAEAMAQVKLKKA